MRCPNCRREWEEKTFISSNTYICPFCGQALEGSVNGEENIRVVLKKIFELYGIELINDNRRIKALLMDYAPRLERERKLLLSVLNEGTAKELLKEKEHSKENINLCINRCKKQLINDIWITENAAQYAVCSIAFALGLEFDENTITTNKICKEPNPDSRKELCKGIRYSDDSTLNQVMRSFEVLGYKACAANPDLQSVVVADSIREIKSKAFLNCINIKSVKLPSEIENIGNGVFTGCYCLEDITIENGKYYTVTNGMLIDKRNKELLRTTNTCEIVREVPNGVKTLCCKSFERNNLQTLGIPKSVNNIEKCALYGCLKLESIEVDAKNEEYSSCAGVLFDRDQKMLLVYPIGKKDISYILEESVETISDSAFTNANYLESITFTNNLRIIENRAFQYCQKIENIVLPSSVEVIGERAFQYCPRLSSVMLSRSIKEIGDYAFFGCESIMTINIPKSVKRIGHMSFASCGKLNKIIIQDNVEFIGDAAFSNCSTTFEICIKNNAYVVTYCRSHGIRYIVL